MNAVAEYLRDHRLGALFIDALGWDCATGTQALAADGQSLCVQAVAHKRGVQVFWCPADRVVLLNRGLLRKLQTLVSCVVHEHILVFSCDEPRKQAWLREARAIPAPIRPPFANLLRSELADQVRAALGRLHPRDAAVIRLRYGLDDREHTLEEVGHQMGLTRERIRQIEKKAEDKLRAILHEEGRLSVTVSDDADREIMEAGSIHNPIHTFSG